MRGYFKLLFMKIEFKTLPCYGKKRTHNSYLIIRLEASFPLFIDYIFRVYHVPAMSPSNQISPEIDLIGILVIVSAVTFQFYGIIVFEFQF